MIPSADGPIFGTYPYVDPTLTVWDIEEAGAELQPFSSNFRQAMQDEVEYLHDHDTPSPYDALLARELAEYTAEEFSEGWVLFWMDRIGWQELMKILKFHVRHLRAAEAIVQREVASWA